MKRMRSFHSLLFLDATHGEPAGTDEAAPRVRARGVEAEVATVRRTARSGKPAVAVAPLDLYSPRRGAAIPRRRIPRRFTFPHSTHIEKPTCIFSITLIIIFSLFNRIVGSVRATPRSFYGSGKNIIGSQLRQFPTRRTGNEKALAGFCVVPGRIIPKFSGICIISGPITAAISIKTERTLNSDIEPC